MELSVILAASGVIESAASIAMRIEFAADGTNDSGAAWVKTAGVPFLLSGLRHFQRYRRGCAPMGSK